MLSSPPKRVCRLRAGRVEEAAGVGVLRRYVALAATPAPPPEFSVKVLNTPLPVTGTVSATLTGSANVNATITGTPTVTILGDELFQQRFDFSGTIVGHCANNQEVVGVPSGKVLIIDNVFVEGESSKNAPITGVLQVHWNGRTHHYRFSPPLAAADPPSPQHPGGGDSYNGSFQTKILAQAKADSILVDGCSFGLEQTGFMNIEVILTGHSLTRSSCERR
jgi:hypothetical protein